MVVISSEWNDRGGLKGIISVQPSHPTFSFFSLREKNKEVVKEKISQTPESERQEVITWP